MDVCKNDFHPVIVNESCNIYSRQINIPENKSVPISPNYIYKACTNHYTGGNEQHIVCAGHQQGTQCPCPSCTAERKGETLWMCDSGASEHFTFDLSDFSS